MSQLNPDDYQNRQQPQLQGCAPCWARASAGIIGPCPSCFRKQNPNPYRDQDGTATKVDPRLHELNRSMTDAERELVDEVLDWEDRNSQVHGGVSKPQAFWSAVKAVRAERKPRKPPEPRPITPEELAVVEAARLVGKRLDAEFAAGVCGPMKDDSRALIDAVRRLK